MCLRVQEIAVVEVVNLHRGSTSEQGIGAETLYCRKPQDHAASSCGDSVPVSGSGILGL